MNYSQSNYESSDIARQPALNQYQTAWLWCQKFWQFSLFYGDYLASLHSRKSNTNSINVSNK